MPRKSQSIPATDGFKLDDKLPKGYLSPSAVGAYLSCPHSYYLRYICDTPSTTTPPLVEGTSMHEVLETNNRNKVKTGEDMAATDLTTLWLDTWATKKKEVTQWDDSTEDDIAAKGSSLISTYRTTHAHRYKADTEGSIETEIKTYIGGVPVLGYIDLINGKDGPTVVDYKVSKTAHSEAEAADSIQLGVYALATGIHRVSYCSLVKTKEPKVVAVTADRTPMSLGKVERVVASVSTAIKAGNFPYTDPTAWKCSMRYCGVWHACPQGGKQ